MMEYTPKMISLLLSTRRVCDKSLDQHLADELNRIDGIITLISHHKSQITKLQAKLETDVKAQMARIEAIQAGCNHESTKHYGDAAGGSDSFSECLICGKELGE